MMASDDKIKLQKLEKHRKITTVLILLFMWLFLFGCIASVYCIIEHFAAITFDAVFPTDTTSDWTNESLLATEFVASGTFLSGVFLVISIVWRITNRIQYKKLNHDGREDETNVKLG